MKHKGITPKGHCFFCDDLTEYAVGKIPICEYCGHKLLEHLEKSREIIHRYENRDEDEQK